MGGSVNFPADREDFSTTASVADQLDALTLPPIAPLAAAVVELAGLPNFPPPGAMVENRAASRLGAVRGLLDDGVNALGAISRLQNKCAALIAVAVEQLQSAAVMEGGILGLDAWQQQTSVLCLRAEIATVLNIPEGAADRLMQHSASLVRDLPATFDAMQAGGLKWEHAVIIAEEIALLQEAGLPQESIDAFELLLMEKADGATAPSFREKARRARERSYPETLTPRTRRAYRDRHVRISRSQDGMSWLNLFASSPAIEAIFAQCTNTARAVQGPHESRTLTQLRADIATALLLGQTMAENHLHTPALLHVPASGGCGMDSEVIPVFADPDYTDPGFVEPEFDDEVGKATERWPATRPPTVTPRPVPDPPGSTAPGTGTEAEAGTGDMNRGEAWAPLPRVTPVVLIPALSLLGAGCEPAWMEGVGPISVEVAKQLMAEAGSFYRVLTDPITNKPLDSAPDTYRITKAMRAMLQIRDEYCQFPGCNTRAVNCEVDHIVKFQSGGRSIYNNLETLCKRHHLLKHYKDDKTRTGCVRTDQSFERQQTQLRGWTPGMTTTGYVGWTSPTGRYYPPTPEPTPVPECPEWLKNHIDKQLQTLQQRSTPTRQAPIRNENKTPYPDSETGSYEDPLNEGCLHEDYVYADELSAQDADLAWENAPIWTPDTVPQPPPGMFSDEHTQYAA